MRYMRYMRDVRWTGDMRGTDEVHDLRGMNVARSVQ
jgi:hypothetical protein